MNKFFKKSACAWMVSAAVALGLMGSVQAQSSDGVTQPTKAKTKAKKKTAVVRGNKVKYVRGSEETTGERNTRLKRECKGRVNAGACEGYSR
ncbi:hypothetical protein [Polaromonas sp.]|uniref:hypothetical protein n=1 Tax=Polaromonas sp. TaxID=1869339 RepID=UPI0017EC1F61|nr:hypothetical protein [Polaromonas sp.]NMM06230.1 hypothetical protein [Polaromonas sp.]